MVGRNVASRKIVDLAGVNALVELLVEPKGDKGVSMRPDEESPISSPL